MFFTTALLAALLPAVALGAPSPATVIQRDIIQLPDLGDGVFAVSLDANGKANVTRLVDASAIAARDNTIGAPELGRRGIPISNGGCMAIHDNHGNFDAAKDAFKDQCNNGVKIPGGNVLYSVRGNAIAYGCSWGGDNPCGANEFDDFIGWAANKCGNYRGAWADMDSWKKQYGMHLKGESFCGHNL
ncbi:hypothetical protein QBC43DRAFT_293945 [Cladorrhinum sp. PSN259]|nr:hypothetical protein QBC43DRAFT_293945 [Cladorrhinum sp. PSN259]